MSPSNYYYNDRYDHLNTAVVSNPPERYGLRNRNRVGTRLIDPTSQDVKSLFERYNGDSWYYSIFRKGNENIIEEKQLKRLNEIKRFYQGANKIKEIVDRHVRSLTGRPSSWYFADPDEKPLKSVPHNLDQQLHQFLRTYDKLNSSMFAGRGSKSALEQAVTDAKICGRGYLRVYDPQYFGIPLTIHCPDPLSVEIGRNENGFPLWIKYSYTKIEEDQNKEYTEHQTINQESGLTEFRTLDGSSASFGNDQYDFKGYSEEQVLEMNSLDLGGAFTVYEFRLSSLITTEMQRLQDGLNYMITLMLRNLGYAGLSRESVLNGLPPGEYVKNAQTNDVEYKQSGELETIPGSQTFIQGLPIFGDNRTVAGYTTPSIVNHEPSSVEHFTESIKTYEQLMYRTSQQAHVLDNAEQLSGISRKELRNDFDAVLRKDAMVIQEGLSNIYTTVLSLLNQEDHEKLSAINASDLSVSLNVTSGEPTPEEITEIINLYQAGVISRITAMSRTGYVEDTDDEAARIEDEMATFSGTPSNPLLPDPQDNPNNKSSSNN